MKPRPTPKARRQLTDEELERPPGQPRGRPPRGMLWNSALQEWVLDPDAATPRTKPYTPAHKRGAPAPRGRAPDGTKWSAEKDAYVMCAPHPDVGKTRFSIVVPPQRPFVEPTLGPESEDEEWCTPAAAPEPSP